MGPIYLSETFAIPTSITSGCLGLTGNRRVGILLCVLHGDARTLDRSRVTSILGVSGVSIGRTILF